jgi:integrase
LGAVIDHYLGGLTANEFRRKPALCLKLFGELLGRGTKVGDLRQKAVTQFMRDICRLPVKWSDRFDAGDTIGEMLAEEPEKVMSPSTYEANYRGPLGTFLKAAARDYGDDGFRLFTVEGIAYTGNRVAEEEQQRALKPQELVTLFGGEEFRRVAADPKREPLYWLCVVMLYTGARPREVCQLNPQVDFGSTDGHWFIDLSDKSAAGVNVVKSIKTGEARRLPLHSELVRLGFPEYLQRLKDAGADRLFPSWRIKGGNPFAAHYKAVADLLRATGLYLRDAPPGELVTGAYTLRKTFITECRNQGVVSKEITGHSDGTTTQVQDKSYIFGPEPLRRKAEQLGKLVIPVVVPLRNTVGITGAA